MLGFWLLWAGRLNNRAASAQHRNNLTVHPDPHPPRPILQSVMKRPSREGASAGTNPEKNPRCALVPTSRPALHDQYYFLRLELSTTASADLVGIQWVPILWHGHPGRFF